MYYCIFPAPKGKGKDKLKQCEIEVKIIKKWKDIIYAQVGNSFHQVMSDTDKHTFWPL